MKIAYFIMAHHKPSLLLRLLNAIYTEENVYLIHIDSGAETEMHELVRDLSESNSNIRILPSRYLSWGGWSLVQAELDAMTYLLNWNSEWSYYINLSGQDFPLAGQRVIRDFLSRSNANYLTGREINLDPAKKKYTQSYYRVEDCGMLLNMGERKPFEEYFASHITPYYGSQWKMITRSFAQYCTTSHLSFEMQDYYRYTFIPDEAFFQTLLLNSEFKDTHINKNYRYFQMERSEEVFLRPVIITSSDWQALFKSEALFARKFDDSVDSQILSMIEIALDNKIDSKINEL
ncbi:beta-1,6-N-acetylglucosaminyltransferase [Paenibacillus timonensis]|uniref:beta-1,6-N-acetylglucosaminyltransferase n=1 Tax=Paenibacillus timonensis TaxID=225915 RepID=UPI003F977F3C